MLHFVTELTSRLLLSFCSEASRGVTSPNEHRLHIIDYRGMVACSISWLLHSYSCLRLHDLLSNMPRMLSRRNPIPDNGAPHLFKILLEHPRVR